MRFYVLACAFLVGFGLGTFAHAQQRGGQDPAARIAAWSGELDKRKKAIAANRRNEAELERQQEALEGLVREIEEFQTSLQPQIDELRSQIKKLGPAPDKDASPEPVAIARERERLNALLVELETPSRSADLLLTRASQLVGKIQDHRRDLFTRQLLKRHQSPLSPAFWREVMLQAKIGWAQLSNLLNDEAYWLGSNRRTSALLVSAFLLWLVFRWLARRIVDRQRQPPTDGEPAFFRQAGSAAWVSLLRMAPFILVAVGAYFVLVDLDALTPEMDRIWRSLVLAVVVFAAIASLTRTLLAPKRPIWRMLPVGDDAARRLSVLIPLMAAVYGINLVWSETNDVVIAPMTLTIAQGAIASLIFALLLIAILLTPVEEAAGDQDRASRLSPKWLKLPLWLAAIAIIVAALLGYVALARFVASQIVTTGLIAVAAVLLHFAASELSSDLGDSETFAGSWLKGTLKLDEPRRRQIAYAVSFALNLLLLVVIVPLALLQWGFSWRDIYGWLGAAFFGFNIGSIHLSVATLLIASALFVAGIVLTRLTQRWLDHGPLNIARIETGIANSIRTGVGYAGFLLSALLAVSYVGLDFTNLAIVAGALSVGIGFGLQSIVNNFVSGLILLVERPIKVGDWVIIGDKEGYVRSISVRATKIETFDRSSLIIPNSELIAGTVTNLTHGNSTARVWINVGVAYDSNAKQVHDLLMEIGEGHPKTLEWPSTKVVFEDFGDSALDFSLRVYIANVNDTLEVRTDLRMAILDRFRETGIEIPFPQRDLHIKDGTVPDAAAAT